MLLESGPGGTSISRISNRYLDELSMKKKAVQWVLGILVVLFALTAALLCPPPPRRGLLTDLRAAFAAAARTAFLVSAGSTAWSGISRRCANSLLRDAKLVRHTTHVVREVIVRSEHVAVNRARGKQATDLHLPGRY